MIKSIQQRLHGCLLSFVKLLWFSHFGDLSIVYYEDRKHLLEHNKNLLGDKPSVTQKTHS